MKKSLLLIISIATVLALFAQQPSKKEQKKMRKEIGVPENFVYIPHGDSSFWMMKTEVSNEMYQTFLSSLKAQGKDKEYQMALTNQELWSKLTQDNQRHFYDTSSTFKLYPVLNISHDAAVLYCKWLNTFLIDTIWEYRLPSREEWMYAAAADRYAEYSMGTPFLTNSKGISLYCYKNVGDECIHEDENGTLKVYKIEWATHKFRYPNHVQSLYPNDWGLYNMCGNAAEMVNEQGIAVGGSWNNTGYDIRIESIQPFIQPSPMVGFRPVLVKKGK